MAGTFELFSRNGRLETKDGKRFLANGENFFGMDCPDGCIGGLWAGCWKSYLDMIRVTCNLIRVPIAIDTIQQLDSMQPTTINYDKNPDLRGLTSGQVLDRVVDYCSAKGLLIVFDNQKLRRSGSVDALWYDDNTSEVQVISALQTLARRYGQWRAVVGIDVKNEPWDNRLTWGSTAAQQQTNDPFDFAAFATRAGNAIHKVNPRLLIFVEGLPWGPNKSNWANWGSNLQYVRNSPIQLKVKDKLVYAPHEYPPGIAGCNTDEGDWQLKLGFIKDMRGPAVVVGEHGSVSTVNSQDRIWQDKFAAWLINKQIDSIYWCFNSNCNDTGGFLQNWCLPDPYKASLLKCLCPKPSTPVGLR